MPDYWPEVVYPTDEWPDEIEWCEPPARLLLFRMILCVDIKLKPGDLIGINKRYFRIYRVRDEKPGMGHKMLTLELHYPEPPAVALTD